jgi:hypothetical protein
MHTQGVQMKSFLITILLLLVIVCRSAMCMQMDMSMMTGGQSARYENIESYLVWSPPSNDYGSKNTGTNTDVVLILRGIEAEEISLSKTGTAYTLISDTCGTGGASSGGAVFDLLGVEP